MIDQLDGWIPKKVYRCKDLSIRQIQFLEAYKSGMSATKSAEIAGYSNAQIAGSRLIRCRRIMAALQRSAARVKVTVTKDQVLSKLSHIVDITVPDNNNDLNTSALKVGISALAEISKIEGHYAPTQSQNVNINSSATIEDIRQAQSAYKKEE